jgi:hypothetical protein
MPLIHFQDGDVARNPAKEIRAFNDAEKNPWLMLAVEGFVNTVFPCSRAIATSIFVVVDLPADPVTTIRPSGNEFKVFARSPGAILLRIRPGKADPPPGRTLLISVRAARPIRMAGR